MTNLTQIVPYFSLSSRLGARKQMQAAMRVAATILLAAGLLVAAGSGAAAAAGLKPVFKVDSAAVSIKSDRMTIIASGAASTGGWGKARLRAKPHKPESAELDFEFVASPPPSDETVIQALVPLTVTLTTRLPPSSVARIRVDAQTNSTTAEIAR
jgi:hypothetical protein